MKKKFILLLTSIFTLFNIFSAIPLTVSAEENSVPNEITIDGVTEQIVVRRKYIYVTEHFVSSSAPKTLWYSQGGFSGNLSLYLELPDQSGTVYGYYRGYVYNDNYPIPLRIEDELATSEVELNGYSWQMTKTVTKKRVYDLESVLYINNSSYSATLRLVEIWGNSDGTWTGVYKGTAYSKYTPLNSLNIEGESNE